MNIGIIICPIPLIFLLQLCNIIIVISKPSLSKYDEYEKNLDHLESLINQPFFAKVNNVTEIKEK